MIFGKKILDYKEEILRDLGRLVAIPSVCGPAEKGMPFGKESARALGTILEMAQECGLSVRNVGNYAGHAEYGQGSEMAAVVTHVDVVPAGTGWDTDPFTLTKRGNLYFGRGTADDKGAAIVALYCLKALKDEKVAGKRKIRAIFGAGEEIASDDLEKYFAEEPMPVMAFTPDSEYGICNREKGIMRVIFTPVRAVASVVRSFLSGTVVNAVPDAAEAELACPQEKTAELRQNTRSAEGDFQVMSVPGGAKVVSKGKASHAMQPQAGFNAATHLIRLLAQTFSPEELGPFFCFLDRAIGTETDGASFGVRQSDEPSGPLTLNLGIVRFGGGEAKASIDIRYPVTADGGKIFSELQGRASGAGVSAELFNESKPLYLPAQSPLITLLQGAYRDVTGGTAELYATGGGTYARAIPGNAVAFGPFFPDEGDRRLHNSNENIDIDRFLLHAQVCLEAVYRMLGA